MSIAALFTGGMLPALVLGLCLCTVVWWRYRKEDLSGVTRYSKGQIGKFFVIALPAIALPFVIRAAVVEGVATAMAWGLTQSGFSTDLALWMASIPGGAYGFLAISIVAFNVLGCVLESIPAIVRFGPLLFPIATQAGVHPVHYSMGVIFSMGIGLFAPPIGVGYYGDCAISKVAPNEGMKYIGGYMAALLFGLLLVAAIPWISTGFLK